MIAEVFIVLLKKEYPRAHNTASAHEPKKERRMPTLRNRGRATHNRYLLLSQTNTFNPYNLLKKEVVFFSYQTRARVWLYERVKNLVTGLIMSDVIATPRHSDNYAGDQFRADPLADATMAKVIGEWALPIRATVAAGVMDTITTIDVAEILQLNADRFARIRETNRLLAQWTDNASLIDWRATPEAPGDPIDPTVAAALEHYVRTANALPGWVDPQKIESAESLFIQHGVLSCLLLFCASLPECYVLPDLADVLHVAGQLENHTEYRIRSTAAMIFPVMMKGGLLSSQGAGVAQILKVRLIHATIRQLILRGSPELAIKLLSEHGESSGRIRPLVLPRGNTDMHHALFAHGWNLAKDELPCNQEELVYTLLTFHFIFLRGMRTLRVPLTEADEVAYLHCWNVMAYVLGIETGLMPQSMHDAEKQFNEIRARTRIESADDAKDHRGDQIVADPRPKLGVALMKCLEDVIPLSVLKGFPSLLTERLCGAETAQIIGIQGRASIISRTLFVVVVAIIGTIDRLMQLVFPRFSLSGVLTRMLGDQLLSRLLLDQTRPLKLPNHLLERVNTMRAIWKRG
jgi:hypothetical protein